MTGEIIGHAGAFGWGLLAQSSLLVAGLLVCWVTVPTKVVGILGGFGAGAMIAAVSFDLLPEALADIEPWQARSVDAGGCRRLLLADQLVERRVVSQGAGGAMGIIVGSVVDGVPESAIFGIQVGIGTTISLSFVAAVFISVPQAIAPSADLAASGWGPRRLGQLWLLVVLACGVAAALGFLATDLSAALAAGGLLAMLTNSLIPFSFERGGALAGAATAVGSACRSCPADMDAPSTQRAPVPAGGWGAALTVCPVEGACLGRAY